MFDNGFAGNGIDIGQQDAINIHPSIITNAMAGPVDEGRIASRG
jgi:hypothetical protein